MKLSLDECHCNLLIISQNSLLGATRHQASSWAIVNIILFFVAIWRYHKLIHFGVRLGSGNCWWPQTGSNRFWWPRCTKPCICSQWQTNSDVWIILSAPQSAVCCVVNHNFSLNVDKSLKIPRPMDVTVKYRKKIYHFFIILVKLQLFLVPFEFNVIYDSLLVFNLIFVSQPEDFGWSYWYVQLGLNIKAPELKLN